jgi:hypothetical protein
LKKVTLKDIQTLAEKARPQLWKDAKALGRDVKIYLHWTAGRYGQMYDDYHINIDQDGSLWVSTDDFSETLAHTWHRNSGSIGVTLCCCYQAGTADLGKYPPTAKQIEAMAQVVAVLAKALWLTIDRDRVLTHAEAADNIDGLLPVGDEYGPGTTCERWDLQYLGTKESPEWTIDYDDPRTGGNVLRGKANYYANLFNK